MSREHFDEYVGSLSEKELDELTEALREKSKKPKKKTKSPKTKVKEDFTVSRGDTSSGTRRPLKARENQWEDTGELWDLSKPG